MQSCDVGRCCEQLTGYRRRKYCAAIQGGDTLRGNKRALDISRHPCISRNLLLLRVDKKTGTMCFGAVVG